VLESSYLVEKLSLMQVIDAAKGQT